MLFEIKGTGTNSIPETKDSTTDTEKLKKDARAKGEYIVTISRDEKGLTEKWFLEAIESELNKDKNRIKEFQSILEKYAGQYKDNRMLKSLTARD